MFGSRRQSERSGPVTGKLWSVTSTAPLDEVRTTIAGFPGDPYLLTVTAEHRPHCATVTPNWDADGARLIVPAPSSWPGSEAGGLRQVSLVWPPAVPGGYSLIIDGSAESVRNEDASILAITPAKAVLHRPGVAAPDSGSTCGSDCVPLLRR